jgi:hypothetical protein
MVRNGIPSSILVPRNGIPSCVLIRGRVRNRIVGVFITHTSNRPRLLNSFNQRVMLLLFLLHGTEFRVVFSSAEGIGTEFRDFLFRGTTGIPSETTICSVYSVFRGIIFLSEIPNPRPVLCQLSTCCRAGSIIYLLPSWVNYLPAAVGL